MKILEYECPDCGRFEALVSDEPDALACPVCGVEAPWVISAPACRLPVATVIRGSSSERPPGALDTRAIADGMSVEEWRGKTRSKIYDQRRTKIRKALL